MCLSLSLYVYALLAVVCVRWWNDIGIPMQAIQVYILLTPCCAPRDDILSKDFVTKSDMLWQGAETWPTWTGENRIWTRTIIMQKG